VQVTTCIFKVTDAFAQAFIWPTPQRIEALMTTSILEVVTWTNSNILRTAGRPAPRALIKMSWRSVPSRIPGFEDANILATLVFDTIILDGPFPQRP